MPDMETPALTDAEMAERVRPLVNEILERFNEERLAPSEAGMVILALVHRLLGILAGTPEARRHFVLMMINMINNFLAGEMDTDQMKRPG
ncbi:MAG: hypothetical protein FJ134_09840 [Deltaproteobacteria bacterium]|nr:hypothetical protein [Deltaproteobacteria bacterium]